MLPLYKLQEYILIIEKETYVTQIQSSYERLRTGIKPLVSYMFKKMSHNCNRILCHMTVLQK